MTHAVIVPARPEKANGKLVIQYLREMTKLLLVVLRVNKQ